MAIALENAGAQRGYLLLESGDRLTVEAEGDIDRADVVKVAARPLDAELGLAEPVIRYVVRTQSAACARRCIAGDHVWIR